MKVSNPAISAAGTSTDQAAIAAYTRHYMSHGSGPRFPAEYLVRIFMGRYPRLDLDKENYPGSPLLEVGCGDGRNFGLFHALGFKLHGTEVSEPICNLVRNNLRTEGIKADIAVGTSAAIPYGDSCFSYLVAWNSSYYLTPPFPFSRHIEEYAPVLAPGGILVMSLPLPSNYIFDNVKPLGQGVVELSDEVFGVLAGVAVQQFSGSEELIMALGSHFTDFSFGEVRADCFGVRNDHMLLVCRKNN